MKLAKLYDFPMKDQKSIMKEGDSTDLKWRIKKWKLIIKQSTSYNLYTGDKIQLYYMANYTHNRNVKLNLIS